MWVVCVCRAGPQSCGDGRDPARDLYRAVCCARQANRRKPRRRHCTGLEDAGWGVGGGGARAHRRRRGGRTTRLRSRDSTRCARLFFRRGPIPRRHNAEPPSIVHFGHRLLGDCRAPLQRRSRPPHAATRAATTAAGTGALNARNSAMRIDTETSVEMLVPRGIEVRLTRAPRRVRRTP